MLPAMHTQTNLDQGLLQVPPSLPSNPLLTLKDKAADGIVPTRKGQTVSNVMEVGKGKRKQYTIKRLACIIIVHPNQPVF